MSNRVEELESKVKELQAAVNGLTEELVETKERVRQLEEEVEVDVAPRRSRQVDAAAERTDDEATDGAADANQAEADKTDDAKEDDNEEKSGESDIIVA